MSKLALHTHIHLRFGHKKAAFAAAKESIRSMTERIEQIFKQKLGDTQVETIRKIQQAFENEALTLRQWFSFKDGRAVESDSLAPQAETRRRSGS